MRRALLATSLLALAIAHAFGGSHLADPEGATLFIAGASLTTRWFATQVLGAAIASYTVAGFATLGIGAPRSWRVPGMIAGAASSLLLAGLVWRGAASGPPLASAGIDVARPRSALTSAESQRETGRSLL